MLTRDAGRRCRALLATAAAFVLCHCGTDDGGGSEDAPSSGAAGDEVPFIEPLGALTPDEDCPRLRTSLDDPSVRELARDHELELERVLARATGEFASTLRWPALGSKVTAAPESGDVPLTIRVSYEGGAVTYADGLGAEGDPPGTETPACPDRVEVEVSVEVATEGGALSERFDAILAIEHYVGEIHYRAPLSSLVGTLSLEPAPPQGSKQFVIGPELDYFLEVSELGTRGRLAVIVREFTDGEDTTRVPEDTLPQERVAAWPAVAECPSNTLPTIALPVAADRGADGVSLQSIGERVAAQRLPFTWADGTQTTLIVSPSASVPTGCAGEDRGMLHWWFDAEVGATSADGSLNGPLAGSVHLVRYDDRVGASFAMGGTISRGALAVLLPASAADDRDYDDAFVDFDVSYTFAWPSAELLGSEGRLSIVAAPPPACDSEECDVRFILAEGQSREAAR